MRALTRLVFPLLLSTACLAHALAGPVPVDPVPTDPVPVDLETAARRLLDTELLRTGDWRATFEDILAFVRDEPDHPLAEAAWALLESRQDVSSEPRLLAEGVAAGLPLSKLPGARWRQQRLTGELAVEFSDGATLASARDFFPTYLSRAWVRGPLPPRERPLAAGAFPERLREPAFGESVEGVFGLVEWQPWKRSNHTPYLSVFEPLREGLGHAQLAVPFHVAGGGPAWIEIEAHAPRSASPRSGDAFRGSAASYAYSINGGEVERVDLALVAQPPVRRIPVSLRDGANLIVLETALGLGGRCRFAVRVLGADGLPHPDLAPGEDLTSVSLGGPPLGRPVGESVPERFEDCRLLLTEAGEGPWSEALLGILQVLSGLSLEGLEHLQSARAALPEEDALCAVLATATLRAGHLPEAWRRSRARELVTVVSERNPAYVTTELLLITILSGEDREEEALERILALEAAVPGRSEITLARARILRSLELYVLAEEALAQAAAEEPESIRVQQALAVQAHSQGQSRAALVIEARSARAAGGNLDSLDRLAGGLYRTGRVEESLAVLEEMSLRSPSRENTWIAHLIDSGERDAARELLEARARSWPRDVDVREELADLALLEGDADDELRWLLEALDLRPGDITLRERLEDRGQVDLARELARTELTDVEEARAAYDPSVYSDSLVFVIDEAVRTIFADGSSEQVTQNLYHARDLDAVEALGSMDLGGADVLALATVEPDGTRLEPIEVAGEYVLPSLDPGDFVHVVTRTNQSTPGDGILRPETWFFASTDEPFHLSRFVISVPTDLGLRFVERNLEGLEREVLATEGRELRRYTARGEQRVLPEPGMPSRARFLPNLTVGADEDADAVVDFHRVEADWYSQVTPEIREAAASAVVGAEGQAEEAERLHLALRDLLDERASSPFLASHVLLTRRGNPSFLYRALLRARGIPARLVWSRSVAPAEDDEPDPDFVTFERTRRRLLVQVLPDDGPAVFCDPLVDFLPYGKLMGAAPGAEALVSETGERLHMPDAPLTERPSFRIRGTIRVATDASAEVEGRIDLIAGAGYQVKKQARDVPSNQLQLAMRSIGAQTLTGLEVTDFELPGLETEDEPLALEAKGRVRTFLDRDGEGLATRLPLKPLGLSGQFADEGTRQLPFQFPGFLVQDVELVLEFADGIELVDPFTPVELECPGGTYSLTLEDLGEGRWKLVRKVAVGTFELPAERYTEFLEFCRAVDNAERTRLRVQ